MYVSMHAKIHMHAPGYEKHLLAHYYIHVLMSRQQLAAASGTI